MFSQDLREAVARGEVAVSIRLWTRPQVKVGGRYRTAGVLIEIDSLEVLPFAAVTDEDVTASGETDRRHCELEPLTLGRFTTTPSSTESSFTWRSACGIGRR